MVKKITNKMVSLLLLVFVFVAALTDAVPTSRSLAMFKNEKEVLHDLYAQGVKETADGSRALIIEGLVDRRMDIETTDYPGTGPNNRHNP